MRRGGEAAGAGEQPLPRAAVGTGRSSHRAVGCHHKRKTAACFRSHGLRQGLLGAPNSPPSLGALGARTKASSLVSLSQDLCCSRGPCPRHAMRIRVWGVGILQGGLSKVSYEDDPS